MSKKRCGELQKKLELPLAKTIWGEERSITKSNNGVPQKFLVFPPEKYWIENKKEFCKECFTKVFISDFGGKIKFSYMFSLRSL